jgi:ion channel
MSQGGEPVSSGASEQAGLHPLRRLLRAFVSADSYGLVLLLIVVSYALAATTTGRVAASVLFVQIATVWFALRTAQARRGVRVTAFVLMALAGAAGLAGVILEPESQGPWFSFASGLLYLLAPFAIIRHIALRPRVDQEAMLGALAAYVMFGMAFAFLFRSVAVAQASPFFGDTGDGSMAQTLFFSFTTLTTTGYGNLVPASNPGQSLAVVEMILGPLFLITAIGKVVSAWRPRRWASNDDPTALD